MRSIPITAQTQEQQLRTSINESTKENPLDTLMEPLNASDLIPVRPSTARPKNSQFFQQQPRVQSAPSYPAFNNAQSRKKQKSGPDTILGDQALDNPPPNQYRAEENRSIGFRNAQRKEMFTQQHPKSARPPPKSPGPCEYTSSVKPTRPQSAAFHFPRDSITYLDRLVGAQIPKVNPLMYDVKPPRDVAGVRKFYPNIFEMAQEKLSEDFKEKLRSRDAIPPPCTFNVNSAFQKLVKPQIAFSVNRTERFRKEPKLENPFTKYSRQNDTMIDRDKTKGRMLALKEQKVNPAILERRKVPEIGYFPQGPEFGKKGFTFGVRYPSGKTF